MGSAGHWPDYFVDSDWVGVSVILLGLRRFARLPADHFRRQRYRPDAPTRALSPRPAIWRFGRAAAGLSGRTLRSAMMVLALLVFSAGGVATVAKPVSTPATGDEHNA